MKNNLKEYTLKGILIIPIENSEHFRFENFEEVIIARNQKNAAWKLYRKKKCFFNGIRFSIKEVTYRELNEEEN